jgi:proline racemase
MFGAPSHMKAASAEILATTQGAQFALAADPYLAHIPVATVTAGPMSSERSAWKEAQSRAARLSARGTSVNVEAANHTTILGPQFGGVVLNAIERVRRDAILDLEKRS